MASIAMALAPSRIGNFPNLGARSSASSSIGRQLWWGVHCIQRIYHGRFPAIRANLAGVEDIRASSLQYESVSYTTESCDTEIKIHVDVSGAKTREIFDDVFDNMVAAAQPIPGFRRVKGGKTPNIPRDILLEILGPSKVYKEVIKKVINLTVAEYVEKEGLNVSKDLKVDESYEDLEDMFEPGEEFAFNAVLKLQKKSEKLP